MIPRNHYLRLEESLIRKSEEDLQKAIADDRDASARVHRRLAVACALAALFGYVGVLEWLRNRSSVAPRVPDVADVVRGARAGKDAFSVAIDALPPQFTPELLVIQAKARDGAERWYDALLRKLETTRPPIVPIATTEATLVAPANVVVGLTMTTARLAMLQKMYAAFNDGIAQVAMNPTIEAFIPLWRCSEMMDTRTRGNPFGRYPEPHRHWQFSGYVNTMRRLVAQRCVYPLGFNCRGHHEPLLRDECERNGFIVATVINEQAIRDANGGRQALIDAHRIPDYKFVR